MNGFEITWSKNGQLALQSFEEKPFDLALIDIMLPVMDGLSLLTEIKKSDANFPVVLLTAKGLKIDKLKGYHAGADDYILKPVDEEELVARIRAVMRRYIKSVEKQDTTFVIGTYKFNSSTRSLQWNEEEKILSAKEAELLRALCMHKNNIIESKTLLKNLWGKNDYFNKKSMDVFIHKLRTHLKQDNAVKIVTVHNKGYILKTE